MKIVALCNQKGGVGKSTLTYHLADALAQAGKKVLIVDADPQGNITLATAATPRSADAVGLADVLTSRSKRALRRTIYPTHREGVDLVPTSGEALALVRDELVIAGPGRESRLREALATLAPTEYDICLIDCPPSLDQLTINALVCADSVVVVTQAKLWSAQGLARLLENVALVRSHYNAALDVSGIAINLVDSRTTGAQHWTTEIGKYASQNTVPILWPAIPKRVAIADSIETGSSLTDPELVRVFQILAEKISRPTSQPHS